MTQDSYHFIEVVQGVLTEDFPYFAKVIDKRRSEFGGFWETAFEEELQQFFGGELARLKKAIRGYGKFALDGMKLQKKFDKDRAYIPQRYADVAEAVYLDRDYMFDLYLPGILLSQYLWPHHFRQREYFRNTFVPKVSTSGSKLFFDIGVGTGFYSKELLRFMPSILGHGFDISPHSLEHTELIISKWGFSERYKSFNRNVIVDPPQESADCLINVEVLEHLEDPAGFLKGLYRILRPGGVGFISAAITAPNADHIYLYNNIGELCAQVEEAGFIIEDSVEFRGYEPKPGDTAPSNGVCIVKKEL